jgi:hypothetical protein
LATPAKAQAARGLGDLTGGIGDSLDAIEGSPVTVVKIETSMRPLYNTDSSKMEDKEIVILTLENGAKYHAWSPSLAEKLGAISPDDLPAVGVFRQAKTRAGFKVWTVDNA